VGSFFIDTDQGTVATQRQLLDVGIADEVYGPPRPWLRIQGGTPGSALAAHSTLVSPIAISAEPSA
jgi:hypothetical protein